MGKPRYNIMFRRFFLENAPIEFLDELSDNELYSSIKFIATENECQKPFPGENQKKILQNLYSKNIRILSSKCDFIELESISEEWNSDNYKQWKKEHNLCIFLFEGELPMNLYYEDTVLLQFKEGYFIYDSEHSKLYISKSKDENLDDTLFDIARDRQQILSLDDYKKLCMSGKLSISRIELDEKNKQISDLQKKNQEKDELLKKYREKYGDIDSSKDSTSRDDASIIPEAENIEAKMVSDQNDIGPEVNNHGNNTDKDNLNKDVRIDINREARYAAKDYLETLSEIDCSTWNPDNTAHIVKNIIKKDDRPITVIITSSVNQKLYLHPWAFAELMENPENVLLNYGSDHQIHSLSYDDIFTNNPNVNLIFDMDIVTPKTMAELANKFMGTKNTCFVIENPKYSQSDEIKSFGLNEKRSGYVETDLTEEDIFNWD